MSEHGEGIEPVDSTEKDATVGPESVDPASLSTSDVASDTSAKGGASPADAVPDPAPEPPSSAPTTPVGERAEAIGSTTNSKVRDIMAKIMADMKRDKSASQPASQPDSASTVVIGAQAASTSPENETPSESPVVVVPTEPTNPTEPARPDPSLSADPATPTDPATPAQVAAPPTEEMAQIPPPVDATAADGKPSAGTETPAAPSVGDQDPTAPSEAQAETTTTGGPETGSTTAGDAAAGADASAVPAESVASEKTPDEPTAGQPSPSEPATPEPNEKPAAAETSPTTIESSSESPAVAKTSTAGETSEKKEAEPAGATPVADAKTTGVIPSVVSKPKKSRGKVASLLRVFMFIGLMAIGLYALLALAWGIDVARHQDLAMRGVRVGETNVGGFDESELETTIDEMNREFVNQPVTLQVGDTSFESDTGTLGARLDSGPMVSEALNARRQGPVLMRPIRWVGSFFTPHDVKTRYAVDSDIAIASSAKLAQDHLEVPIEPELLVRGSQMIVSPGEIGTTVAPRELIGRLPAIIEEGEPYELELLPREANPVLDTEAMQEVADDINEQTSEPILVKVLDKEVEVNPRMQKSWVLLDVEEPEPPAETTDEDTTDEDTTDEDTTDEDTAEAPDEAAPVLSWSIDDDAALEDLKPLFPSLGSEDQQAKFSVVDGEPIIIPASETVVCCEEDSGERLGKAMKEPIPLPVEPDPEDENADEEAVQPLRTVTLRPVVTDKDEGVAELESLGIVEEVSTFTTKHRCCQNRVKNIQRFADLTQGVIIRPGEEFSLNEFVGQRTREKGFVADGAIAQGVIEPQVGGGISQYATTFFNATFFAGLEFVEYQSHSIYISRYPRGREATISWRKPDLKIRNNTEYGILVWNEYTPTSITVSFYSTKHLEVEALALRRASERQCRVDITPRVITYEDGTTFEDSVQALYRPGEGLDCNGNSTRPEEE